MIDRPSLSPLARLASAGVCIAAAVLLAVSAGLAPADEGHGTHEQLGLPACSWAKQFDAPCMTCGMTTAFSHAAEGSLGESFLTQPMGMLLAVLTAAGFWVSLHAAATGSMLVPLLGRMLTTRVLIAVAVLGGAAWVYKIVTWQQQGGAA